MVPKVLMFEQQTRLYRKSIFTEFLKVNILVNITTFTFLPISANE